MLPTVRMFITFSMNPWSASHEALEKKDYGRLTVVAIVILVGSGSFCVLLLLYGLYYYALTGQRNFTNRAAMVVYYVLPAVLAAFLLASLASFSSFLRTVSPGAYFRYHQHQPFLTIVWLTKVPSG